MNMWGVIDIGSNTIRLVIYSLEEGKLRPMLNKKYAAGLAGYLGKNGKLSKEGIEKLLAILNEIQSILQYVKVENVYPFATAALRNSTNGQTIVEKIKVECGMEVRILTGEEEAIFDYYSTINSGTSASGLLVDVGGGSTELTLFREREILSAVSFPIGSLTLYKHFVKEVLPTEQETKQIKKEIKRCLQTIPFPEENLVAEHIYSVGGTARASLKLLNRKYGRPAGYMEYTYKELKQFLADIEEKPRRLLDQVLCTSPERVHTIVPGMLIFETVAKYYHAERFTISHYGVREGYLMYILSMKERVL